MQVVPSKGEGETATAPNSDRSDRAAPPEDSGKRRTADNTHVHVLYISFLEHVILLKYKVSRKSMCMTATSLDRTI